MCGSLAFLPPQADNAARIAPTMQSRKRAPEGTLRPITNSEPLLAHKSPLLTARSLGAIAPWHMGGRHGYVAWNFRDSRISLHNQNEFTPFLRVVLITVGRNLSRVDILNGSGTRAFTMHGIANAGCLDCWRLDGCLKTNGSISQR
jgi:hypothetical protein